MSDRMTLDPALLPHLERQLRALSGQAHDVGASAHGLATWASGADPTLAAAAEAMRASRALGDTSGQLDAMRRDVSQRASLLELEGNTSGSGRAELTDVKRGDMATGSRRSGTDSEGEPADGLSVLSWFAFLDDSDSALDFGVGLLHAEMGNTDSREVLKGSRIDVLSVIGDANPRGRWGKSFSAQAMSLAWMLGDNSLGLHSFEANVGRVQGEASIGKDGATLGASASLGDVSATFGRPSEDSGTDSQVRLGTGAGIGLTGRLHWSDEDRDADREYGFGVDLKFIAVDVKTEALDDVVGLAMGDDGVERRLESNLKPLGS